MRRLISALSRIPSLLVTRPVASTLVLWLLLFAYFAASALLAPLASGPDETAHYVYSAAVARGQTGTLTPDVPAAIAHIHEVTCFAYQPNQSAACQVFYDGRDVTVESTSHVGLYNPVFYAWTGLGSLVLPSEFGLYLARMLSGFVAAGIAAWAIGMVLRTSRNAFAPTAILLLTTPMVAYMCSVLNPSGWEIVSALAVAVAGYRLLVAQDVRAGRWTEVHSLLGVAGAVLLVSRGLSPLIAVLILVGLVIAAGPARAWQVIRRPVSLWLLGVLAAVGAASIVWVLLKGTNYIGVVPTPDVVTGVNSISVFFVGIFDQVRQMFGWPGWLDVEPPGILVLTWLVLVIGFMAVALLFVRTRERVTLLLAAATAVFLPAVLSGMQWSGTGWQGRYTLPIVAAMLIIAGLCLSGAPDEISTSGPYRSALTGLQTAAVIAFPVFHIAMAAITVHRYTAGISAPVLGAGAWSPPGGSRLLLAVVAVCVLALTWLIGFARTSVRVAAPTEESLNRTN
jgi:hypothetical protein